MIGVGVHHGVSSWGNTAARLSACAQAHPIRPGWRNQAELFCTERSAMSRPMCRHFMRNGAKLAEGPSRGALLVSGTERRFAGFQGFLGVSLSSNQGHRFSISLRVSSSITSMVSISSIMRLLLLRAGPSPGPALLL